MPKPTRLYLRTKENEYRRFAWFQNSKPNEMLLGVYGLSTKQPILRCMWPERELESSELSSLSCFYDDMIEVNSYPLSEIEEMVKHGNRRIGLGVMGFAHMLYRLGIPYSSNEAVRISERLSKFIRQKAEEASLELGEKRGTFPNWDISIYAGSAETYRNCAFCMIAPTGTISMLCNCSSGIEVIPY